jgi:hypothetical protein
MIKIEVWRGGDGMGRGLAGREPCVATARLGEISRASQL